jgi:CRISPR-associated protein Cas1
MRLIITDFGSFLGVKRNRFQERSEGVVKKEVSSDKVEQIMIAGKGCALSADAIRLAVKKNIDVVFVYYGSGRPYARVLPSVMGGTVITRRKQFESYDDGRSTHIAKGFVDGKVMNEYYYVKTLAKNQPGVAKELTKLADGIKMAGAALRGMEERNVEEDRGRIMAIEGRCAELYWNALKEVIPERYGFTGREKRGAKDITNSMLNYGYGMLRSEVEKSILYAGMDPFAGFLHADRPGKPSLVLDLMEEFRTQVVDRTVVSMLNLGEVDAGKDFKDGMLTDGGRKNVIEAVLGRMDTAVKFKQNRKLTDHVLHQARELAAFLRGERQRYEPFFLRW